MGNFIVVILVLNIIGSSRETVAIGMKQRNKETK